MCALICAQSGNRCCCAVNSFSRTVERMERRKKHVACLWVAGLQCVPSVFAQGFPKLEWRARGRLSWWLFVEAKVACCRPNFVHLSMGHTAQLVFALLPTCFPICSTNCFQSFSFSPGNKEMLQLLANLFRHTELLKVRHGDRLLLVFCIPHCLLPH